MIIGANQQAVKNIAELRKVLDSKPSVLALNILARRQHHLPVNAVISLNPFLKTEGVLLTICELHHNSIHLHHPLGICTMPYVTYFLMLSRA